MLAVLAILCGVSVIGVYLGALALIQVKCPAPEFDYGCDY